MAGWVCNGRRSAPTLYHERGVSPARSDRATLRGATLARPRRWRPKRRRRRKARRLLSLESTRLDRVPARRVSVAHSRLTSGYSRSRRAVSRGGRGDTQPLAPYLMSLRVSVSARPALVAPRRDTARPAASSSSGSDKTSRVSLAVIAGRLSRARRRGRRFGRRRGSRLSASEQGSSRAWSVG